MGISANDLCQHVIRPTLDYLSCHSPAAEALLLGAAACQSALGSALDDRRGHGLYRIASERHQQLWDQYLALDPERASRVRGLASQHAFLAAPHLELTVNLRYSTAIAWSLVEAARLPLPDQHDHLAQARVWRQVFQPHGRLHEFIDAWQRCIGSSARSPDGEWKNPASETDQPVRKFFTYRHERLRYLRFTGTGANRSVPHPAELRNTGAGLGILVVCAPLYTGVAPTMKTIWFKTSLALTISAVSTYTLANGIAINEQSASGAGTAYAGRASSALDASTIYGNPAGLSKLKRTEVSGGLAIVKAKDDISQAHSTAQGSNKGDSVPLAAVPFGYFSTPINEDFTFGLGIYVPYGIINDYENGFMGSSHGSYSKVQVITVQPTIAWKINDKVSVGFGPTFNRIDGQLKNTLATNGLLGSNGDTKINIKGDDTAIGYNVGVMVDLTDDTTWGLTYHSKVKYHLGGNTEVKNAPGALGLNGKYDAKLDITLPESVDTSITHKFDDKWTGYLGAVWTRWSRLEKIEVRNSGVPALGQALGFNTIGEDLNWRDTWSFSVGTSYQATPEWVLRTGFAYEPSPTSNEDRNVRIPVGDRKVFTVGAGWSPNQDLTVDVAYAYLWETTAGVNQEGSALQPAYSAKYDNSAHGLTAQVTYRF